MQNHWPIKSIAECAAPEPYSTQIGPFGKALMADEYTPTGVPVLRGINVNRGRFHDDDFVFISEETADRLRKFESYPEDVLLVHKGTLGEIGLMPKERKYRRYIMGNSMLRVRCDPQKLLPEYLYYWLSSAHGRHYLLSRVSQVGVPQIQRPLTTLREARLPVPPLSEQRAIARVLGTLDDKIELNRRMNETLEGMEQALFKSWFLDGTQNGMPEAWRRSSIRELTTDIQYGLTQSASSEPIGPRFLRITDIQGGRVNWSTVPFCKVSPDEHKRYRLKEADVLVARTGASTGENIYLPAVPDAVFASYLVRFQFSDPAIARFVGAFMRTTEYFDYVAGSVGGSAQPNASAQVLAGAELVFPTLELVHRYAKTVAPIDRRIFVNNEESHTLAALRDALLPKMLSAEIRAIGGL